MNIFKSARCHRNLFQRIFKKKKAELTSDSSFSSSAFSFPQKAPPLSVLFSPMVELYRVTQFN
jgi:hypothetical protein